MRRVVLSFWTSLDGYSCDEGSELYRVMREMPDDEEQDEYFASRPQPGTHIMGRVTYEVMAEFWPKFDNPVARMMNDIPKVVFSRTLRSATWPESQIASGDTADEIATGAANAKRRGSLDDAGGEGDADADQDQAANDFAAFASPGADPVA